MELKHKQALYCFLFGFLACIFTGIFFYGFEVFDFTKASAQFVIYGFFGSVFYTVFKFKLVKSNWLVLPVLILINIIIVGRSFSLTSILRDTFFVSSLCGSIYIYIKFINSKIKLPRFIRAIVLGLINWFTGLTALVLLIYIFNSDSLEITNALIVNGSTSTLIGLGLALGFDLHLKYESKLNTKNEETE